MGVVTERPVWRIPGVAGALVVLLVVAGGVGMLVRGGSTGAVAPFVTALLLFIIGGVLVSGFHTVQPNEAAVIILLGRYLGTNRDNGWWLTVPLTVKRKVSLRVRNFNSDTLKVNDANGSPIEIAAVVVFRVVDAARAVFDVDNYEQFVDIQSETALRHLANLYPYDSFDDDERSLRGNPEELSQELSRELQERLSVAGVAVLEARLSHLAYAPEIAHAMLQRQQAAAILAARQKIVEGAVGMVQMAVAGLQEQGIVELDEERKAVMINNLMVAIVGERAVQPVINAGSLY